MTAQTTAQRQRAYKARKRALGLVQATQVWVHPEDVQRVREYAASLRKARGLDVMQESHRINAQLPR